METISKRGSGKSGTYRRYPSGQHRIFDAEYNAYRVQSTILNEGKRSVYDIGRFSSIQSIEYELYLLVGLGDKLGRIEMGKIETYSAIAQIQSRLRKLKRQFNEKKESMLLSGYSPDEIFETKEGEAERLINEAHLDIKLAEVEHLQKLLSGLKEKQEEEEASKVLMNGPEFTRKGSPPKEVDGQIVGRLKDKKGNEFLIIDDSRSMYNGMSLTDYKQLCQKWMLERVNARAKLEAAQKKEIMDKGFTSIHVPLAGSKPKRESFPSWPDGVKNHIDK